MYAVAIFLYRIAAFFLSFFSPKAKEWTKGHAQKTADVVYDLPKKEKKRIWFHISSLGEYEQARSIIEKLATHWEIVLTFYSPSGYHASNVRKYTPYVYYMGVDTTANAQANFDVIQPDVFVLVKYDFWLRQLQEIQKNQVPIVLISAIFRANQIFFKSYGKAFKKVLKQFNHIFLQDAPSAVLLKNIGIEQTTVNGDTRIDSVLENAEVAKQQLPANIAQFVDNKPCLVVGSSYETEEKIIFEQLDDVLQNWKIIIAPHNIGHTNMARLSELFSKRGVLLSQYKGPVDKQVLIIDQIGLLKYLYVLGNIAFVGGGFGKTVHNTLEPAAFKIPIIFGPAYDKFPETVEMVATDCAFVSELPETFKQVFIHASSQAVRHSVAIKLDEFLEKHKGASAKVLQYLKSIYG
ncbi:hypothetical protein GC194_06320 [bacterium]|nr:hypothetical protein [bacterium]